MASKRIIERSQSSRRALPGFGPKSTRALAVIGIHSIEQLEKLDLYDVYRRLKSEIPGLPTLAAIAVPYCVATYGAVSYRLRLDAR
jgi:hypothetical protein